MGFLFGPLGHAPGFGTLGGGGAGGGGSNIRFSELDHVAYQIKGDEQ